MEETQSFIRPDFLKTNQQLKFIADSVSVHLNYIDKNQKFVFVNKAAADFWNLTPETMVGKTIRQLAGDEKYFDFEPFIEKVLAGENTIHEITLPRDDGSVVYFINHYIPDFNSEGRVIGFVTSGTDVTASRLAYQKAEKEQTLREHIIYALSHDLRTPIAAAKISSQLLLRKTSDASIQKLAFRIEDNMDRADKMIQDLLDASMVKAGNSIPIHVKDCDIHRVLITVIEEFSLIHGNRFKYQGPEELVGEWDCDGIRRILENLISNAIKYGDPVAKIYVKAMADSKKAVIKVINFGPVIGESDVTTLFNPFKRVKHLEHIKGWGIGLSLVKGLTEAHGGHVTVSSSKEEGTVFTVTLPLMHKLRV